MNLDNYNILKGIVKELRRELTELENEIQYNLRCMKEADIYVHSFLDEESADFKVFSPRNNENVHKNESAGKNGNSDHTVFLFYVFKKEK